MQLVAVLARVAVTLVVLTLASVAGYYLWDYYMRAPWTRDGRVRADVVQVAPDVSGIIIDVRVRDNQEVRVGDVLFVIDRARFHLALRQARATVESRKADAAQARRDADRLDRLTTDSVSVSNREGADTRAQTADAAYQQALADLDTAKLNLARTEVRAPVNGAVTNFGLRPGTYARGGSPVLALVDADSFHVDGYFEETKLPRIAVGDRATVRMMGVGPVIEGHVEGVASGIVDRERGASPNLLANVNPTFTWVRLAQRVPVRIAIDRVPPGVRLVAGRTVTVNVLPGDRVRVGSADPATTP